MENKSGTKNLFIKELIRRVHQELLESQNDRQEAGLEPLFIVKDMTVEVNFVVTETKEKEGGLDFKVVTASGSKQYLEQQVQKITLHLSVSKSGGDWISAARRAGPVKQVPGLPRGGAPLGPDKRHK